MSTSSETLFGQDKNMVIAVASAIIFTLAVGMLVVFANQGATKGWDGNTVLATVFSSMIALIFVSVAVTYGFLKGKEAGSQALSDIEKIRAKDKALSDAIKKAADDVRNKEKVAQLLKEAQQKDAKEKAVGAVINLSNANKAAAVNKDIINANLLLPQQNVVAATVKK